jgi:hypothetical protein
LTYSRAAALFDTLAVATREAFDPQGRQVLLRRVRLRCIEPVGCKSLSAFRFAENLTSAIVQCKKFLLQCTITLIFYQLCIGISTICEMR